MLCCVLACGSGVDEYDLEVPINEKITGKPKATATVAVAELRATVIGSTHLSKITATPIPEPTIWVAVIDCPEC